MDKRKVVFLFRSWIIGMVVVVVYFMLNLQHFFIGLILGIINTFITDRFVDVYYRGNKQSDLTGKALIKKTLKNIVIAILISLVIRGIDYLLLTNNLINMPIEPFRFILYYQVIYYGVKMIYDKFVRRKKNVKNN